MFRLPRSLAANKAQALDSAIRYPSLIITGDVIAQSLASFEYKHLIRGAGGTAAVSLTMLNTSDEEYPDYPYPLATLTAESASRCCSSHVCDRLPRANSTCAGAADSGRRA